MRHPASLKPESRGWEYESRIMRLVRPHDSGGKSPPYRNVGFCRQITLGLKVGDVTGVKNEGCRLRWVCWGYVISVKVGDGTPNPEALRGFLHTCTRDKNTFAGGQDRMTAYTFGVPYGGFKPVILSVRFGVRRRPLGVAPRPFYDFLCAVGSCVPRRRGVKVGDLVGEVAVFRWFL